MMHFCRYSTLLVAFFLCSVFGSAQSDFTFKDKSKKTSIPFKLVNNLIIIEVKVNGVLLNFLLDTGVEETLLVGLESNQELYLKDVETVKLKGLGAEEPIDGLKAQGNILEVGKLWSSDHLLYVILQADLRFSASLGIPVNGILGYNFFKNHLVEINYQKKKITVYNAEHRSITNLVKKFTKVPILIERSKPYVFTQATVVQNRVCDSVKLLVDTGNSSALWLFQGTNNINEIPEKRLEDILGYGFSGVVKGKRSKIELLKLDNFEFKKPVTAFPDKESLVNVKMVANRSGSIGGDILKRFNIIFDYQNGAMYLKANSKFSDPFEYNKSGIYLQQAGVRLYKLPNKEKPSGAALTVAFGEKNVEVNYQYAFKPAYEVAALSPDAPAAKAGIQIGDVIISVNEQTVGTMSLLQVANFFKSEKEEIIVLEVDRSGELKKFRFQLKNILD